MKYLFTVDDVPEVIVIAGDGIDAIDMYARWLGVLPEDIDADLEYGDKTVNDITDLEVLQRS